MPDPGDARWMLLIHQIPPTPAYLRVKVGRRLQGLGAVAVKNSVYVLPRSEQALEDFQWVRREIVAGGGDASVCEARFVDGLSDEAVEALFSAARDADYAEIVEEARALQKALAGRRKRPAPAREQIVAGLTRLRRRFEEVAAIDFFAARTRDEVEGILSKIENALRPPEKSPAGAAKSPLAAPGGRTWVTRSGVHIDRMASAWLIRRFIDPEARLKFVRGQAYKPAKGEIRFDMFEAEFTHEGDLCTFEGLLRHFDLRDPALGQIAEIVHDIDLKDAKFSRPEALGLDRLVAGIAMRHQDDEARVDDGAAVFEALYEYFRRKT
jgi:hypothetical protein